MDIEANKAVYRRFIDEVFNQGRFENLDELLAPSYAIEEAPPGSAPGAGGVKQGVTMFRDAFPDLQITLDDVVAEGDKVCARSTLRGTHQGAIFGIQPTGKSIAMTTLTMVTVIDGKLTSSLVKNDVASLMRQLGAGDRAA